MPAGFLDAVRNLAPDALAVLAELMNGKRTPGMIRLRAAELILQRAYGLPLSAAEIPDLRHELRQRAPSVSEILEMH